MARIVLDAAQHDIMVLKRLLASIAENHGCSLSLPQGMSIETEPSFRYCPLSDLSIQTGMLAKIQAQRRVSNIPAGSLGGL